MKSANIRQEHVVMASACFSFGRRFPGLAGAECLSEGDFTEPGWRTDYGGGKRIKMCIYYGMEEGN